METKWLQINWMRLQSLARIEICRRESEEFRKRKCNKKSFVCCVRCVSVVFKKIADKLARTSFPSSIRIQTRCSHESHNVYITCTPAFHEEFPSSFIFRSVSIAFSKFSFELSSELADSRSGHIREWREQFESVAWLKAAGKDETEIFRQFLCVYFVLCEKLNSIEQEKRGKSCENLCKENLKSTVDPFDLTCDFKWIKKIKKGEKKANFLD